MPAARPRGANSYPRRVHRCGAPRGPWLHGAEATEHRSRVLRTALRQEGDLAAAWVVTSRRTPSGSTSTERDWIEHLVLRRIDGDWRILSVAAVSAPRGSAR